jgi:hypothetical protein
MNHDLHSGLDDWKDFARHDRGTRPTALRRSIEEIKAFTKYTANEATPFSSRTGVALCDSFASLLTEAAW